MTNDLMLDSVRPKASSKESVFLSNFHALDDQRPPLMPVGASHTRNYSEDSGSVLNFPYSSVLYDKAYPMPTLSFTETSTRVLSDIHPIEKENVPLRKAVGLACGLAKSLMKFQASLAHDYFFDEFSYNIVVSQLLSDKVLVSNYAQKSHTERPETATFKSLTTNTFEKLYIKRSNNDTFDIELVPNYSAKLCFAIARLAEYRRRLVASLSNDLVLVSLMIAQLISIRRLVVNRAIYFSVLHKKIISLFHDFTESSKRIDVLLKRTVFSFKEYSLYNQVSGAGRRSVAPGSSVFPAYMNPEIAQSTLAYLEHTVWLYTSFFVVCLANLVGSISPRHDPQIGMALLGYSKIHGLRLTGALNVLESFASKMGNSSFGIIDVPLKPLHLSRSPELRLRHVRGLSGSSFSEKSFHKESGFKTTSEQYEKAIDDLHSIRKLYLVVLLIVGNESFSEDLSQLEIEDVKINNIVSILRKIHSVYRPEHSLRTKTEVVLTLYDEMKECQRFYNDAKGLLNSYFKYTNTDLLVAPRSELGKQVAKMQKTCHEDLLVSDLALHLRKVLVDLNGYDSEDGTKSLDVIEANLVKLVSTYQNNLSQLKSYNALQGKKDTSTRRSLPQEMNFKQFGGIDSALRSPQMTVSTAYKKRQHSVSSIGMESTDRDIIVSAPTVSPTLRNNKRYSAGLLFSLLKISETEKQSETEPVFSNALGIVQNTNFESEKYVSGDVEEEEKISKQEFESQLERNFLMVIDKYEKEEKSTGTFSGLGSTQVVDEVNKRDIFLDQQSFLLELGLELENRTAQGEILE